jgi:endogenous inhibitor of DNA gyrase (YacG/DUF329 family)
MSPVEDNFHSGDSQPASRLVRCPSCGGDSVYAASNAARPFCSVRCKNMDFGAWASESFRVAAPPSADDLDVDGTNLQ